jgi:hypothetical protein
VSSRSHQQQAYVARPDLMVETDVVALEEGSRFQAAYWLRATATSAPLAAPAEALVMACTTT